MTGIEHDWIPTPEAAYEEEARGFYASLDEDWIPAPDDELSEKLDKYFLDLEQPTPSIDPSAIRHDLQRNTAGPTYTVCVRDRSAKKGERQWRAYSFDNVEGAVLRSLIAAKRGLENYVVRNAVRDGQLYKNVWEDGQPTDERRPIEKGREANPPHIEDISAIAVIVLETLA